MLKNSKLLKVNLLLWRFIKINLRFEKKSEKISSKSSLLKEILRLFIKSTFNI